MTPFEKQVYYDMQSTDRVLLWMIKCQELMEFSEMMTKEDILGLKKALKMTDREDSEGKAVHHE